MYKIRRTTNLKQLVWLKFIFLFFLSYSIDSYRVSAQAPVTFVIGATASTSAATYGPIWTGASASGIKWSRYAHLYTAADLVTAANPGGIPSGARIVKVEWLKANGGTIAASNTFNVWLANSTSSTLTVGSSWSTLLTGASQTYANAAFSILGGNDSYVSAPFNVSGNDSFTYTGGSLLILTDWVRNGVQTGTALNFYRNAATGKAIGANGSAALSGSTTLSNGGSLGDFRPTIRITYVPVPACSGIPNTGNAISSAASACPGTSFTLSIQNIISGTGVSYVWQRANDIGFTFGLTTLGTSSTLTTVETSSSYYRCVATCSGSGSSFTSPPVYVPLSPSYLCQCASNATSAADEEIYNFTFGSLSNSSNCTTLAPGAGSVAQLYSNYQSIAAPNVEKLSSVAFSIQVGTCLNQYPNRSAIFIDYNQNAVFEANELVYSSPIAITGAHTEAGNIVIPSTALTGTTGIRVITSEQAGPITSACGTYSWGETEDYVVNITPTTLCSGAPIPGNTIASSTSVCSGKTISFSLQNLTTGVGVTYQWFAGGSPVSGATSNVYVSNAIFNPTTFYCAVTCTNSGQTTNSTPITITMNSFIDCYCPSQAGSDADEDIFSFTFNGGTFGTNCTTTAPGPGSILGRYSNFYPLGNIASLNLGASVPFDIESDDCDQAPYYSFGTAIWIDFNQNGSFNDVGERVYAELVSLDGPRHIIGNIAIPCTAKVGQTAMRVTIAEGLAGSTLTSCLLYGFGETEDYKIFLKYPDTCSVVSNPPGNTLGTVTSFCDSASSVLTLQNKCMFDNFFYQWYKGDYPGVIIPGATTKTYTTPMLTSTTTYYCSVSCGSSTVISTPLTIPKVVIHPTTIATASGAYCIGGTPVTLSTTHTFTGVPTTTIYSYSPSTGLSSNTGSPVSATPQTNTVYTVTATDINGCYGTATVSVAANYLNVHLTASSSFFCQPNGSPVTLTSTGGVYYGYSPVLGLSSDSGAVITATPSTTTKYIVTGVDSFGCNGKDSVIIGINSLSWVLDADNDGYYIGSPIVSCTSPGVGYTTSNLISGDCNDNNSAVHQSYSFYTDADGDGYGTGPVHVLCAVNANTPPSGYAVLSGDCNDANASVHPGAVEICGNGIDENCNGLIDEGCNSVLNLTFLIEGYYIGSGLMTSVLLNEGVGISATETDIVEVELRNAGDLSVAATATSIVHTNGMASFTYPSLNGSYYAVIKHRNSIQTWSANPIVIGAAPVSYDFTSSSSMTYGGNSVEVEPGVWAIYSCDLNLDENVDLIDLSVLEIDINAFGYGYVVSDVNGDGNVDLLDSPLLEENINLFIYSSHP